MSVTRVGMLWGWWVMVMVMVGWMRGMVKRWEWKMRMKVGIRLRDRWMGKRRRDSILLLLGG